MKKGKNNPRKKRPNPGSVMGDELTGYISRSMGPMILAQAIPDATLTEIMVIAAFLPMLLKVLRGAGEGAAESVLDKLFPEGGEIFPGITLERLSEEPGTANANPKAEPGPAGGK